LPKLPPVPRLPQKNYHIIINPAKRICRQKLKPGKDKNKKRACLPGKRFLAFCLKEFSSWQKIVTRLLTASSRQEYSP